MRKSKFTESQIVTTLKQVEGGWQVKDVCRELGISDATYYGGSPSTAGWRRLMCSGFAIWKRSTTSSSGCTPMGINTPSWRWKTMP